MSSIRRVFEHPVVLYPIAYFLILWGELSRQRRRVEAWVESQPSRLRTLVYEVAGGILFLLALAALLAALFLLVPAPKVGAEGLEESKTHDGQSLLTQPAPVQQMFFSALGANAPVRWVIEHAKELFGKSQWGYGWGGGDQGPFIYDRGLRRGGGTNQRLVTAHLYSPYTVQSYQFTLPSTEARYRGATGDACETRVEAHLDYQGVSIALGRMVEAGKCDGFYSYPYLMENAKGERVPNPHPTRPHEVPMKGWIISPFEAKDVHWDNPWFTWKVYVDDRSMDLVVKVHSSSQKDAVFQLRVPQGFGVEIKQPCKGCTRGWIYTTFWNDTQGWSFVETPALYALEGQLWSLWRMNFLTLHRDGTVEFEELPFLLNPQH